MTPFSYRDDHLWCEDVALRDLAEQHGTPLYVYSHGYLVGRLRELRAALGDAPHLVAYSVKANPNLAVVAALCREGAGADVVSGGELQRALRAGVPPDRIVFAGVGKTEAELRAAVEAGILQVNVEVEEELAILSRLAVERDRTVGIAVRVNPDVPAGAHPYIEVGRRVNKFGLPLEDAPRIYRAAAALPGLRVQGIACHIGSQILDLGPFRESLRRVATLVNDLRAEGIDISHVDVGGGLGVRYRDEQPPSLAEYAATLREQTDPLGVTLVLEPGRILAANAGVLLTRVLYRKQIASKRFVIVDAAMNDLMRPALYGARHRIDPVQRGADRIVADVVGPVCETGDFLLQDGQAPDAAVGDLLAVHGAGAYGRSMASNYNTRPRGAEVLVRGGEAHLIQERETLDPMLAGERIPEFLLS